MCLESCVEGWVEVWWGLGVGEGVGGLCSEELNSGNYGQRPVIE